MRAYLGLASLKAYAALVGAIATALVAEYGNHPAFVVAVIVATAITTWRVPNADVEPKPDTGQPPTSPAD